MSELKNAASIQSHIHDSYCFHPCTFVGLKISDTNIIYLIVIPWAQVVCLIYTPKARGLQAQGLRVHISGEPRVHMV